jgi:hypothetical protein
MTNVNINDFLQTIYCHDHTHNPILQNVHEHIIHKEAYMSSSKISYF